MKYLETGSQRKSLLITTTLFLLLFLLFFYLKIVFSEEQMTQLEGGGGGGQIEVNFGDSESGSGVNYKSADLEKTESKSAFIDITDDNQNRITQISDDAPVIASSKKNKKNSKAVEKTVDKEQLKPSKSTSDALLNILNGSKIKEGDGDDKIGGNKGKLTGSLNEEGYSGGGTGGGAGIGSGSGGGYGSGIGYGNYELGARNALSKPQPKYICNEQGVVVVRISVDKTGRVISAEPGMRGTTNLAKCLLDQAKIAAMNTKWQSDNNAPEKQVGKIVYNFKLTE